MANREIWRGAAYALRWPLYEFTLYDRDQQLFDLSGCTILGTFKAQPLPHTIDEDDQSAPLRQALVVGLDGIPTIEDGLYLIGDASAGTIEQRLTAADTRALPPDMPLQAGLKIIDANGEPFIWEFSERIVAKDPTTNRTEV